ncbi:hypothetical protein Tco_0697143 [Tanacetum coccineum]
MVQNQSQLGEGSAIPTDPHHTSTFIQPSTQPQKIQQPRKPKRKDTQVHQPSDPIENVADEAVHKELGDSLVRAAKTVDDITLAQALEEIKSTKPKKKGVVIKELGESTTTISSQLSPQQSQGKGLMKKLLQIYKLNLMKKKDFRTELVKGKEKRAGTELIQEITKKQKVEDNKEIAELKQLMEIIPNEEEVAIDAIPLVVKSPSIVGWKIYKEGRKSYYQIMRADGKSQMYMIFSQMLKSFDREDLEDFYKLVKAKYESTRPVEDLDLLYGSTFLDDATCAYLYVGKEEVSPCTTYTFNDVGKEAYN